MSDPTVGESFEYWRPFASRLPDVVINHYRATYVGPHWDIEKEDEGVWQHYGTSNRAADAGTFRERVFTLFGDDYAGPRAYPTMLEAARDLLTEAKRRYAEALQEAEALGNALDQIRDLRDEVLNQSGLFMGPSMSVTELVSAMHDNE